MDYKQKFIINEIDKLSDIEYQEIFKIIKDNKCNYTKNNNGIFINILKLSNSNVELIYDYINFSKDSKLNINNMEKIKDDLTDNINNIILKNKEIDNISNLQSIQDSNIIQPSIIIKNKITSTMKFYILRKKMNKTILTIQINLENVLDFDDIFI